MKVKNKLIVHIGFDDIDTPYGGCTTHFASMLLIKWIKHRNIELIDYPNLIRLNPGVPWKTRGNGSVVIRFMARDEYEAFTYFEEAVSYLDEYLGEYSSLWKTYSHPSIAMYIGEPNSILKWFSKKALYDLIPLNLLERVLDKLKNNVKIWSSGRRRGLIGCLGGIGYRMLDTDYTYELLIYRSHEYLDSKRQVDENSIIEMDKRFGDKTLLNYDYEENRTLIIPRGPDPVLLGIRGEDPDTLLKAFKVLRIYEPVSLAVIYRTNQHTDAHHKYIDDLSEAYIYRSVRVRVYVSSKPRRIRGGHVIFKVSDGSREVDVAVYQPTGGFRNIVEKLEIGDEIEIMGVVRPQSSIHGKTINLEKLRVISVKPKYVLENPLCPRCGARLKSMGRGKGFKCVKCGFRSRELSKIKRIIKRDLEPGWYEPPPRVFKHLMKPLKRYGREKKSFPQLYVPQNFVLLDYKIIR